MNTQIDFRMLALKNIKEKLVTLMEAINARFVGRDNEEKRKMAALELHAALSEHLRYGHARIFVVKEEAEYVCNGGMVKARQGSYYVLTSTGRWRKTNERLHLREAPETRIVFPMNEVEKLEFTGDFSDDETDYYDTN